jgi:hypothetical protein
VRLQHRLHGVAQPGERLAAVGVFAVAAAVAGVDLPLRIQEEDGEGQVVIELEEVQVEVIDAREPDADEALGDVFDLLQTDNLPVKLAAGRSRLAAQHHHQRLAALARLGLALFEAAQPAVAAALRPAPPLGQGGRVGHDKQPEGQDGGAALHNQSPAE